MKGLDEKNKEMSFKSRYDNPSLWYQQLQVIGVNNKNLKYSRNCGLLHLKMIVATKLRLFMHFYSRIKTIVDFIDKKRFLHISEQTRILSERSYVWIVLQSKQKEDNIF